MREDLDLRSGRLTNCFVLAGETRLEDGGFACSQQAGRQLLMAPNGGLGSADLGGRARAGSLAVTLGR